MDKEKALLEMEINELVNQNIKMIKTLEDIYIVAWNNKQYGIINMLEKALEGVYCEKTKVESTDSPSIKETQN